MLLCKEYEDMFDMPKLKYVWIIISIEIEAPLIFLILLFQECQSTSSHFLRVWV